MITIILVFILFINCFFFCIELKCHFKCFVPLFDIQYACYESNIYVCMHIYIYIYQPMLCIYYIKYVEMLYKHRF